MPISRISKPNGDILDFYYSVGGGSPTFQNPAFTLLSIVSNHGYMMKFQNVGPPTTNVPGAVAVNLALDACSPIAVLCSFAHAWPSDTQFSDPTGAVTSVDAGLPPAVAETMPVVTRPNGRVETFTFDAQYLPVTGGQTQQLPTACSNLTLVYNYGPLTVPCPFQHLVSYNDGMSTWNYTTTFGTQSGPVANYITTTIARTNSAGGVRTTVSIPSGQIVSDTDELGHLTTINTITPFLPNEGRVLSITYPEKNSKSFNNYDARGNIWQQVEAPKPGSTLANKVTNYVYPTTCTNWKICNKPTSGG
jgi:hypothetical protein